MAFDTLRQAGTGMDERAPMTDHSGPRARLRQRLAEGGLAAVTWPAECGGAGRAPHQQVAFYQ